MRVVTFFFLLTIFNGYVYGVQNNYEVIITPDLGILQMDGSASMRLEFPLGLESEHYRIRLVGQSTQVSLKKDDTWVSNTLWADQNLLGELLTVRLMSSEPIVEVIIEIQDVTSGEVYKSKTLEFWNYSFLRKYLSYLNVHMQTY